MPGTSARQRMSCRRSSASFATSPSRRGSTASRAPEAMFLPTALERAETARASDRTMPTSSSRRRAREGHHLGPGRRHLAYRGELGQGKFPVLASRFHATFVFKMVGFHLHLVFRRLWFNVFFSQIIPHGSCALERGQIT